MFFQKIKFVFYTVEKNEKHKHFGKKTKNMKIPEKSDNFGDFTLSMTIHFFNFFESVRFGSGLLKVFT